MEDAIAAAGGATADADLMAVNLAARVRDGDQVHVPATGEAATLPTPGAVVIFINILALRQAATPEPMLGRMTATMRWLTLLAAGPGALFGGWLGEHLGLRSALAFAGGTCALLAIVSWRLATIRSLRQLPRLAGEEDLAAEAEARPAG